MNAEVIVVPPTAESWPQEAGFRVEYLNRSLGSRALVYFDNLASAREFAAESTLWNQPCTVQSRDMPCTHEVKSVAVSDRTYVYWTKRFGDLETAQAEFDRGRAYAKEKGGSYLLIVVGHEKPLASFSKLGV